MKEANNVLKTAICYLKRSWAPIPLCPPDCSPEKVPWHWKDGPCRKPGKNPLIKWTKWQTKHPTENDLRSWWRRWPWANVGILTGAASGVFDLELEAGESLKERPVPPTLSFRSGGGGTHFLFKYPGFHVPTKARIFSEDGPKADLRGDGGLFVAPPSRHISGAEYAWLTPPDMQPAEAPDWLVELLEKLAEGKQKKDWQKIANGVPEGCRNETAASYIGKLLAHLPAELWESAGWDAARAWNERNQPPLDARELRTVFESIAGREAAKRVSTTLPAQGTAEQPQVLHTIDYEALRNTFQKWLSLPSDFPVRFILAAAVANKLKGDPFWAFLIGPSGSCKTELLNTLTNLPWVKPLDTLTVNTFLSGKQKKDPNASLLKRLPDGTILLMRDFTTVLEMHREKRAEILAQLRKIYDGHLSRATGEGGESAEISWTGKMGLLAGVTPAIEGYRAFATTLGERFLYFYLPEGDRQRVAATALANREKLKEMREELRRAVAAFLQGLKIPEHVELQKIFSAWIVQVADFVSRARTAVTRDYYTRDIVDLPDPEVPTRLAQQLGALACAHAVLFNRTSVGKSDFDIVREVILSCIPTRRRLCLAVLAESDEFLETSEIAEKLGLPTVTARRDLEDLAALGIVDRIKQGEGRADTWRITTESRAAWENLHRQPIEDDSDTHVTVQKAVPDGKEPTLSRKSGYAHIEIYKEPGLSLSHGGDFPGKVPESPLETGFSTVTGVSGEEQNDT